METRFPLLADALRTGNLSGLFHLMKDWPEIKLRTLLQEIESFEVEVDKEWGVLALMPRNFFNQHNSQQVDAARMELETTLGEIASVVYHYLPMDRIELDS